jgi:hypothetical protein
MSVRIRPFRPEDVDAVRPLAVTASERAFPNWRAQVLMAAEAGPAWTAEIDGVPIGYAGMGVAWRGRAQAWCILGDAIPKRAWVALGGAVQSRMAQMRALGVWRIEAEVLHGYLPGHRWVRMLGFAHEGVARAYGPDGHDFHRYALVFDREPAA